VDRVKKFEVWKQDHYPVRLYYWDDVDLLLNHAMFAAFLPMELMTR
jgi:hypothetical protein